MAPLGIMPARTGSCPPARAPELATRTHRRNRENLRGPLRIPHFLAARRRNQKRHAHLVGRQELPCRSEFAETPREFAEARNQVGQRRSHREHRVLPRHRVDDALHHRFRNGANWRASASSRSSWSRRISAMVAEGSSNLRSKRPAGKRSPVGTRPGPPCQAPQGRPRDTRDPGPAPETLPWRRTRRHRRPPARCGQAAARAGPLHPGSTFQPPSAPA